MLSKLLRKIISGNMFKPEMFDNLDENFVLDSRDDFVFENDWLRVSNDLEEQEINSEYNDLIHEIAKQSFITVYNITGSDELASYISDDFELISKAIILGYNDAWMNSLILSYANQIFPYGKLELIEISVNEVVNNLIS